MAFDAGAIVAKIQLDSAEFESGINKAKSSMGGLGDVLGPIASKLNLVSLSFAGLAAAGMEAAGRCVVAFQQLQWQTGETGRAFDEMRTSVEALGKQSPESLHDIADVVSLVHQRTSLTGKSADELAEKYLKVGHALAGGDADTVARTGLAVQVAWGQGADAIDKFVVAAQKSGAPIQTLLAYMDQFGANFRNMGYSFDESLALMAKFEKSGVNAGKVFAGLRVAVMQQGLDEQGLKDRIGYINKLIDSGQREAGIRVAKQTFGRGSADVVDAIQRGVFDASDMESALKKPEGAAEKLKDNSLSASIKTTLNTLDVSLQPIGASLANLTKSLLPLIKSVSEFAGGLFKIINSPFGSMLTRWILLFTALRALINPVSLAIAGVLRGVQGLSATNMSRGFFSSAWTHASTNIAAARNGMTTEQYLARPMLTLPSGGQVAASSYDTFLKRNSQKLELSQNLNNLTAQKSDMSAMLTKNSLLVQNAKAELQALPAMKARALAEYDTARATATNNAQLTRVMPQMGAYSKTIINANNARVSEKLAVVNGIAAKEKELTATIANTEAESRHIAVKMTETEAERQNTYEKIRNFEASQKQRGSNEGLGATLLTTGGALLKTIGWMALLTVAIETVTFAFESFEGKYSRFWSTIGDKIKNYQSSTPEKIAKIWFPMFTPILQAYDWFKLNNNHIKPQSDDELKWYDISKKNIDIKNIKSMQNGYNDIQRDIARYQKRLLELSQNNQEGSAEFARLTLRVRDAEAAAGMLQTRIEKLGGSTDKATEDARAHAEALQAEKESAQKLAEQMQALSTTQLYSAKQTKAATDLAFANAKAERMGGPEGEQYRAYYQYQAQIVDIMRKRQEASDAYHAKINELDTRRDTLTDVDYANQFNAIGNAYQAQLTEIDAEAQRLHQGFAAISESIQWKKHMENAKYALDMEKQSLDYATKKFVIDAQIEALQTRLSVATTAEEKQQIANEIAQQNMELQRQQRLTNEAKRFLQEMHNARNEEQRQSLQIYHDEVINGINAEYDAKERREQALQDVKLENLRRQQALQEEILRTTSAKEINVTAKQFDSEEENLQKIAGARTLIGELVGGTYAKQVDAINRNADAELKFSRGKSEAAQTYQQALRQNQEDFRNGTIKTTELLAQKNRQAYETMQGATQRLQHELNSQKYTIKLDWAKSLMDSFKESVTQVWESSLFKGSDFVRGITEGLKNVVPSMSLLQSMNANMPNMNSMALAGAGGLPNFGLGNINFGMPTLAPVNTGGQNQPIIINFNGDAGALMKMIDTQVDGRVQIVMNNATRGMQ